MKSKIVLKIEGGVCEDLVAWPVRLDEAFGEPSATLTTVEKVVERIAPSITPYRKWSR